MSKKSKRRFWVENACCVVGLWLGMASLFGWSSGGFMFGLMFALVVFGVAWYSLIKEWRMLYEGI